MSYRDNASLRSPTLEQLAERARATRVAERIPNKQRITRADEIERLELAVGVDHDLGSFGYRAIFLWLVTFCCSIAMIKVNVGLTTTQLGFVIVMVVLATTATIAARLSGITAAERRALAIATELDWEQDQPFEIEGYRAWLVSETPLMIVRLRSPIDRLQLRDAMTTLDPELATEMFDTTSFSVVVPSCMTKIADRPVHYGNIPLLKKLFEQLVVPLHHDIGIEEVSMGGRMEHAP